MSQSVENTGREYELQKKVHLLQQQRDLTIMELTQYKDRESQLKRLNQTLMKAITEQKPDNDLLHEIKLIIEQTGGSDREKSLEAEIDRMRKDRDREVEERVQKIVQDGKVRDKNTKCLRCEELQDRILKLQSENKRSSIIIVTLTNEKSHLTEELARAAEDFSILERRKADIEQDLKRVRQNQQQQLEKLKDFKRKEQDFYETERMSKIQAEWREKLSACESNNHHQMQLLKQELEDGYQHFIDEKINEIVNKYEDSFQQKLQQVDQRHQQEVDRLLAQINSTRRESRADLEDMTKKVSRITPTKARGTLENNAVIGNFGTNGLGIGDQENQAGTYKMARPTKSRTVYFGADNPDDNKQEIMKGEIQNIISGLSKTKQTNPNGSYLYQTGMNTSAIGGYGVGGGVGSACSQYSNFSIKDSINRPNTILESHLRLKRNIP